MKNRFTRNISMLFFMIIVSIAFSSCFKKSSPVKDMSFDDYMFGKSIEYPLRKIERTFPVNKKQGYFTIFEGLKDMSVKNGILSFTLANDSCVLGWGNYLGNQNVRDVQDTFQECGEVILKIRQSSEQSNWNLNLYRDGSMKPLLQNPVSVTVDGEQWQEIVFKSVDPERTGIKVPEAKFDAMGFSITGEPGAVIQIEWVKLVQHLYAGYCRKEFEIPEGKIWSAVANVGSKNYRNWHGRAWSSPNNNYQEIWSTLYINGEKVERKGALDIYFTAPVDISSFVSPGKNCIGFYGSGISEPPFIYFQTKIIMESGEVIEFASSTDWRYSPEQQEGWNKSGFDDSAWSQDIELGIDPLTVPQDGAGDYGIPAYTGRLIIKNPGNKDLFYTTTDPVVFDIEIPAGLKAKSPELSYFFGKSDSKGISRVIRKGTVTDFKEVAGSLVFQADLKLQSEGIYTLALRLKDSDGKIIEERSREPLVVLKRLDQKPITGTSDTEGLVLELEDYIDFTDPSDPHSNMELHAGGVVPVTTPPVIKREGTLVYREVTDSLRGAGFSYDIEFKHPGSFYYFELEYPDNKQRIIEVIIKSMVNATSKASSQAGLGVETGGRFLPTGKMQTLSWIHVADPGPHRVDIAGSMDNEKAAARSLKIYRVKGNLPSLVSGTNRRYGIHTEKCSYESGIGKNFGTIDISGNEIILRGRSYDRELKISEVEQRRRAYERIESVSLVQSVLENLNWLKEAGERYVQYLKYTGQNIHIMACYQYSEKDNPGILVSDIDDSRILNCPRTMMANIFEINDIDFYAGVEFSQSEDVKTYSNNAQVAQGAESAYMINAEGRQMYGFYVSYLQNWLYPETQNKYYSLMGSIGRTYGHLSRFKGVHNFTGIDTRSGGYWMPGMGVGSRYGDPLQISYDDITFSRFEQETGIKTGVEKNDPERFVRRATFLKNNTSARELFLTWRCNKFREFISEALTILRNGSERDVDLVNVLQLPDYQLYNYLYETGRPIEDLTRELGYDISGINSIEGLWTGRWTIGWRHWYPRPPHRNPYTWIARTDPEFISAFDRDTNRFVFVRTSWDENVYDGANIRTLPQPGGYHCREAFIQAIITGDPELLIGGYTDLNINVGFEHILRGVFLPFTKLPKEKFIPILSTGLTTNVAIRQLNKEGESYFYFANPCQWSISGSITVDNPGEIIDLVSGDIIPVNDGEIKFALDPFGLLAYRSSSPGLNITGYKTDPVSVEDYNRLSGVIEQFKSNVKAGNGLDPGDIAFLKPLISGMDKAMQEQEYAKAWSLLTEPRVWSLKTSMEKL